MTELDMLTAKDAIRDLVLLYSRGVDRKDVALLRTLYTADATDSHGDHYDGDAAGYLAFLDRALPHMRMGAHHVCNHLIAVDPGGETAEGEVYAIAWHLVPDRAADKPGGMAHDLRAVRYIDRYAREDGRWKFARRVVSFDAAFILPAADPGPAPDPLADPSYRTLAMALFARR